MIRVPPSFRALVACLCAMGAFAPAEAQATPYAVDFCAGWDSGAPAAVLPGLSVYGANALFDDNCGAGGPIRLSVFGNQLAPATEAGLRLTAPADRPSITIGQLWTAYALQARSAGSNAFFEIYADAQRLSSTIFPPGAGAPAAGATVADQRQLPAATRSIGWNILCSSDAATTCDWPSPAIYDIVKARLFLDEGVAPTLTVTGGTLSAGGPRAGQQTVTFDAADADSGVASATVSLDATIVAQATYPCPRTDWSACARDRAGSTLIADTTKVPDGAHVLTVEARDAAGNAVTRSAGTVTVANGSGPAAPNGAGASRLAKLTARFASTSRRSRVLGFTSSPTVKGTLVDEGGKAIGGATVAILARPRQSGGANAQIATATTGADGAFSLKLPSGPSRTITFAYTAFAGDARPAASASLKTSVRAVLSARIAPRSVRAGHSIVLSGRLALLPRAGIEVKIQARQGPTWRTVDDVRTTTTGTFRWRYRFPATQARRVYAFRVRVASPIYPFAAANSNAVSVRVR